MSLDRYLRNATVVTENDTFSGGIFIDSGKIVEILPGSPDIPASRVDNLRGKVIMPGLVDSHVHLNEPGRTEWEGYLTGSMAAASGGITTFLDMPLNCVPYTTNRHALLEKRNEVIRKSVIDYGFWGGLVDDNLAELPGLAEEGVIGFKAFMSDSGVDFRYIQDDLLCEGLAWIQKNEHILGVHALNQSFSSYRMKRFIQAGRLDRKAWCETFPPDSELEAILRAIYWAKVTGGRLHIVHVSIAEGLRAIAAAREAGVPVSGETCPHYLFLDEDDFERIGPAAKCAPPLRTRDEVEALWECLAKGYVDLVASDHSPCTWAEKEKGLQNIWQAWGGISGLQTMLPVMLSEGYHKRNIPLPTLVRLMAGNPARFYGLYPQKGALMPGADADLVVIDLEKSWQLKTEGLLYRNPVSPYIGCTFTGQVVETIVRGATVFREGSVTVQPGYGLEVRRGSDGPTDRAPGSR